MPKKTSRPTKSNQQRSREEQWRRRVAAQTGRAPGAVATAPGDGYSAATAEIDTDTETVAGADGSASLPASTARPVARTTPRTPTSSTPRPRVPTAAAPVAATSVRRAVTPATRPGRGRATVETMSLDEEMSYVRSDVRMLILLTVICVIVIIVLSFVINR